MARAARDSDERAKVRSAGDFLEEHGLALAFLAAVAAGIFMSVQVLQVALSDSASVNLEEVRAARCFRAQRAALAAWGGVPVERLVDWRGRQEFPLTRSALADLVRRHPSGVQLFCAEQGPLKRPDSGHYILVLGGDGALALRCGVHGVAPAEAPPEAVPEP